MNNVKYCGFYQVLYEVSGNDELVKKLHNLYWGDTVKLPKHLYNSDYVMELVMAEDDVKLRRELSKKYGYTYDTISKKIRTAKHTEN